MSTELKPCPFCGGTDIRFDKEIVGYIKLRLEVHAFCNDCDSIAGCGRSFTEQAAIEAWNRRATDDATKRTT